MTLVDELKQSDRRVLRFLGEHFPERDRLNADFKRRIQGAHTIPYNTKSE